MFLFKLNRSNPRKLLFSSRPSVFSFSKSPAYYVYTQNCSYVDVYMKWKKDPFYDSIESIHKSIELKPLIALKNCITAAPSGCIPISAVSKRGKELGLPSAMKVARFLRQYPSVFEEFTGPNYNLPWFRLTAEAVQLDREECEVYEGCKADLQVRLKKLVLMSGERRLPLKIIQGMQWYLGLPDEFLQDPERNLDDGCFRVVEMEDGLKGLAVESEEKVFSVMQKNAIKRGGYGGGPREAIGFPLFRSKGLRLKQKILNWLDEFQSLPYVSPYENDLGLHPDGDIAEKRVVGVLHELLSLFVEHAAERKKILCLRKFLRLPQKMHKAFERHPYIFYLSLRNKTCTAILKEAYSDKSSTEAHPLSRVRKRYISLMKESEVILKSKRVNNQSNDHGNLRPPLDLDYEEENRTEMAEGSM
ncbi:protein WHAT'S THIS FACTOR 9, mitochondrial [Diospyros lotus]|uniref:protein WHAT'S THIS FACTOR 9, mitochondrial n=1 Tax=Diospyros lotus TaxID=55363 RepID=UPI00225C0AB6|nr:protein WHAT'S THIS FACTOR 9, mitochondrial [Diospyros lotus]XP_052178157.1 protein WHAT'S THIS FACTOR 9, mitochondrial [Diospyros lotus]